MQYYKEKDLNFEGEPVNVKSKHTTPAQFTVRGTGTATDTNRMLREKDH
jgi:hypothetical protein